MFLVLSGCYAGGVLSRCLSVVWMPCREKVLARVWYVLFIWARVRWYPWCITWLRAVIDIGPWKKGSASSMPGSNSRMSTSGFVLPVVIEGQDQLCATLDSFGLFPGEEDAELIDPGAFSIREGGQAGELLIVAEWGPGIDQDDKLRTIFNSDVDM